MDEERSSGDKVVGLMDSPGPNHESHRMTISSKSTIQRDRDTGPLDR